MGLLAAGFDAAAADDCEFGTEEVLRDDAAFFPALLLLLLSPSNFLLFPLQADADPRTAPPSAPDRGVVS